MANQRGRNRHEMGGLFTPYVPGGAAAPAVGQPVMVRMQGVPTMPGYRDRPGKWNLLIPPLLLLTLKVLLDRLSNLLG